jgi:hypothetical protein
MLNSTLQLKIKQRLNKLDSQDYENLECWQIIEAFNKAQIEWVRRQIMGRNMSQEGAEQTVRKVDDLQNLLTPVLFTSINAGTYYETEPLPSNYLEFHKIDIEATDREDAEHIAKKALPHTFGFMDGKGGSGKFLRGLTPVVYETDEAELNNESYWRNR